VEGEWGVRVDQTQEMKGKESTGDLGGPDAIRPEAGSVRPEKKVLLLMYLIFNIILFIFIERYSYFKYVKPIIF